MNTVEQLLKNEIFDEPEFSHMIRLALTKLDTEPFVEGAPEEEQFPRKFGNYLLLKYLARGGMGQVYLARQEGTERLVALKMVLPELASSWNYKAKEILSRFRLESKATAKLDHPSIVTIYEFGEYDGQAFYSMKYIEGCTLRAHVKSLDDKGVSNRNAAEWLVEISEAIHQAHLAGILHRDLKPSNILIDGKGTPYVTDFGLAAIDEQHSAYETQSGALLGTVAYMSPEQTRDASKLDARSDVYSLGAILYFCLTGEAPFGDAPELELMRRIREDSPTRPGQIRTLTARDLETICLHCLRKNPPDRYQNAGELARDLRNFLEHQPIAARRPGIAQRTMMWCKRNRSIAVLSGLLLISVFSLIVWAILGHYQERDNQIVSKVKSLLEDRSEEVPQHIVDLQQMIGFKEKHFGELTDPSDLLRMHLAFFEQEPERLREISRLASQVDVDEITATQILLSRYRKEIVGCEFEEVVWSEGDSPLCNAILVSSITPEHPSLNSHAREIAVELLAKPMFELTDWVKVLRGASQSLTPVLMEMHKSSDGNEKAKFVLAISNLNQENPSILIELLSQVELVELNSLWPVFSKSKWDWEFEIEKFEKSAAEKPSESERLRCRLNFALAKIKFVESDNAWNSLAQWRPDGLMNGLSMAMANAEIDMKKVVERLDNSIDADERFGLLLALGNYDFNQLSPEFLNRLKTMTRGICQSSNDAGVRAAAEWILRTKLKESPTWRLPEQAMAQIVENDHLMVRFEEPGNLKCRWRMNVELHTRAETKEFEFDLQPFSIGDREVTNSQFKRFIAEEEIGFVFQHGGDYPVVNVSYDLAARYCNWLTLKSGLGEQNLCYKIVNDENSLLKAVLVQDAMERRGFRLPLETEWEYACSSGLDGSKFYGTNQYRDEYCWNLWNSNVKDKPALQKGGLLKPNRFGLFDVFGNCAEWTRRVHRLNPETPECLKGGSFYHDGNAFSRFNRMLGAPDISSDNFGFRIAQSIVN